jgi:sensor c-di-GMP phosphodiesterase-like protein
MHSLAKDRQILENDLRNAVMREELKLLYQPLVNSVTEEVVGSRPCFGGSTLRAA